MSSGNPKLVIILSGKRKSGKDYIGSILEENFPTMVTLRIAGPIKAQYAKDHGLDFEKLLDASEYKENHRKRMVEWSESIRKTDPNYFLRIAIEDANAYTKPVWMLTDARRETDLEFFKGDQFKHAKVVAIRIVASEEVRKTRGWIFTPGIDDAETECGLDKFKDWNIIVQNESLTKEDVVEALKEVLQDGAEILAKSK